MAIERKLCADFRWPLTVLWTGWGSVSANKNNNNKIPAIQNACYKHFIFSGPKRIIEIERKAMIRNRYNYLLPSVPRHQRERRTHLKERHHNQNTTSRKPKGQILPKNDQTAIQNQICTKTNMQRHTMTDIVNHSKSTAFERSVKILLGEGA